MGTLNRQIPNIIFKDNYLMKHNSKITYIAHKSF